MQYIHSKVSQLKNRHNNIQTSYYFTLKPNNLCSINKLQDKKKTFFIEKVLQIKDTIEG